VKIYVSHKRKTNFIDELYEPLKKSGLANKHDFIFPHDGNRAFDSTDIITNKKVDLIIAEVSYPATGQGIEIGWAFLKEIPVICVYKKGADIAGSLKSVTDKFVEYDNSDDLIKKLSRIING
jgi:nucleoside 2-deoxyribosyltransferase